MDYHTYLPSEITASAIVTLIKRGGIWGVILLVIILAVLVFFTNWLDNTIKKKRRVND